MYLTDMYPNTLGQSMPVQSHRTHDVESIVSQNKAQQPDLIGHLSEFRIVLRNNMK